MAYLAVFSYLIMIKTIEFSNILGLKKAINLYDFQLIAKFPNKIWKIKAWNELKPLHD